MNNVRNERTLYTLDRLNGGNAKCHAKAMRSGDTRGLCLVGLDPPYLRKFGVGVANGTKPPNFVEHAEDTACEPFVFGNGGILRNSG